MKRTSLIHLTFILGATAAVAAGCDPVASDGYQGEVLATLHGQVSTPAPSGLPPALALPPVEVALVWGRPDGTATKFVAEKVPIAGTFPAEFTVDLHHPPPASAGGMFGGVRLNQGFIAALARTDWRQGTVLEKGRQVDAYGLAAELLVHLDRSVAVDAPLAVVMGGIHDAGFHMVTFVEITAAQAQTRAAACRQVLGAEAGNRCDPSSSDGKFHGMVEVEGGLDHVIKLQLTGSAEELIRIVGGDAEDVPCPDCDDPVSSGGGKPAPPVGGNSSDGGVCGASSGSSAGSGDGGAAGPGCAPGGGTGDPLTPPGKP